MSTGLAPLDPHDAKPGDIETDAGTFERLATRAIDLDAVTNAAFQPAVANWDGICAPELRAAPKDVRNQAQDASGRLAWTAVPLRVWASKVRSFNSEVSRIKGDFDAQVSDHYGLRPHNGTDPDADDYAKARHAAWASAVAAYYTALNDYIYDGATTVAGMLKNGPTEENLKTAYALGVMPTAPGAFTVFPTWWHRTNMEQAAKDARALADRLMSTDHDPSMTDLSQFKDLLDKYASDPAFAYYFLNELGPHKLLMLNGQLATLQLSYYDNGNQPYFDTDLAQTVGAIQTGLGLALAAATHRTGHLSGPGTYTPGPYELPASWTVDLMEEGRKDFTLKHDDALGERHWIGGVWGYQLLDPLLGHGDYDPSFLSTVGGDIVDFEMSNDQGSKMWQSYVGSNLRLDWSQGWDKNAPAGWDPVLPLLDALDRNPEAAKQMFTGIESFEPGADPPLGYRLPRLDYLLTDRTWFMDVPGGPDDPRVFQEGDDESRKYMENLGLDRLGDVLDKATTTGPVDSRSLAIVDSIVYEINVDEQARGEDNGGSDKTKSFEDNDLVAPVMRDSMADIMKAYIFDVNKSMSDYHEAMPGGPGAQFDQTQLIRFLADVGKDEGAHKTIQEAEGAYSAAAYDYYLNGPGSVDEHGHKLSLQDRLNSAQTVAASYGRVMGSIDFGAAAAEHQTSKEADDQHNSDVERNYAVASFLVDQVVDKAKEAVPVPVVGDLASTFIDHILDSAKEDAMADHTGVSDYNIGTMLGSSRQASADLALTTLYESGQLHLPDQLMVDGHPKPFSTFTDSDTAAWERYLSGSGAHDAGYLATQAGLSYDGGYNRASDTLRSSFH